MTPTIIATIGASDANSFGTRVEADLYHASVYHPGVIWPVNISASASIGAGANGIVTITLSSDFGTDGNAYTVVVVLGSGNDLPLSAALVGQILTVTLGTDGSGVADPVKNTAVLVAGAISNITNFSAVASGTGATVIPVTSSTAFSGGSYREDLKHPALIMAQQQMTSLICWTGFCTTLEQKLPWPRNSMWARNDQVSILPNEIPDEVKWCQFELARLLVNSDRTKEFAAGINGLTYLRASSVTLKFKETNPGPPVMPQAAWGLLVESWYESIIGVMSGTMELKRT